MIAGFEVGAALTLATAKFDSSMLKSMDLVRKMTESMERLRTVATGIFSETGVTGLNRGLLSTERRLGAVTAETQNLTRAMGALAESGAAAAAAVGGGFGGGAIGRAAAGGGLGRVGGLLGGAAAIGIITGTYQAAKLQDSIVRALVTSGVPIRGDLTSMPEYTALDQIIRRTATTSGIGFGKVEDATLDVMRQLSPLPFDSRIKALGPIMDFMALEVRQKGVDPREAATGAVELAHMTAKYKPEEIAKLLPAFAQFSTATKASISQLTKALSYVLPVATLGEGIDPIPIMAMATQGAQMNLSTKSGTWLASLLRNALPGIKGLTEHQRRSSMAGLHALGLIDDQGKSTILGPGGLPDPYKMMTTIEEHAKNMSPAVRMAALQNAFKTEGSRAAVLFSDPAILHNLNEQVKNVRNAPTLEAMYKQIMDNSPIVKLQVAEEKLTDQLINLGGHVLPKLTTAIESLNATFDFLNKHTAVRDAAGGAVEVAGAAWTVSKLGKFFGIGGATGLGSAAALAAGEISIASIAAATVPLTMAALTGYAVLGPLVNGIIDSMIKSSTGGKSLSLGDWIYNTTHPEHPEHETHPLIRRPNGKFTPGNLPSVGGAHGGPPININHVHIQMPAGTSRDHLKSLHDALTHAARGAGSMQSPHLAGGR